MFTYLTARTLIPKSSNVGTSEAQVSISANGSVKAPSVELDGEKDIPRIYAVNLMIYSTTNDVTYRKNGSIGFVYKTRAFNF